jgi:hypothetical protein
VNGLGGHPIETDAIDPIDSNAMRARAAEDLASDGLLETLLLHAQPIDLARLAAEQLENRVDAVDEALVTVATRAIGRLVAARKLWQPSGRALGWRSIGLLERTGRPTIISSRRAAIITSRASIITSAAIVPRWLLACAEGSGHALERSSLPRRSRSLACRPLPELRSTFTGPAAEALQLSVTGNDRVFV